jgi:hypothetical protein
MDFGENHEPFSVKAIESVGLFLAVFVHLGAPNAESLWEAPNPLERESTWLEVSDCLHSAGLSCFLPAHAAAQCGGNCSGNAEASNVDLAGYNDLQGRTAYIPTIEKRGDRWITYAAGKVYFTIESYELCTC